jgi:DNA-binding MarR family transcriptional regulator
MPEAKIAKSQTTVDVSALEDLIGFHIRLAMLAMRRSFFRHVGGGDVRPGLSSLLQVLSSNQSASQTELAASIGIDKATIVSLIDAAESSGWIQRSRDPRDRRRHVLILTDEGKAAVKQLRQQTRSHEKKFRARFSDKELNDLIEYLKRIYA